MSKRGRHKLNTFRTVSVNVNYYIYLIELLAYLIYFASDKNVGFSFGIYELSGTDEIMSFRRVDGC